MPKQTKTLKQQIRDARIKVMQLEEEYLTQVYFETMPEYTTNYKYCYSTANQPVPYPMQTPDAWLRAIVKHMATRREGHGGAYTDAYVVTIPDNLSKAGIELWIEYVSTQLRKRATRVMKKGIV